jgi:hypothetical protein
MILVRTNHPWLRVVHHNSHWWWQWCDKVQWERGLGASLGVGEHPGVLQKLNIEGLGAEAVQWQTVARGMVEPANEEEEIGVREVRYPPGALGEEWVGQLAHRRRPIDEGDVSWHYSWRKGISWNSARTVGFRGWSLYRGGGWEEVGALPFGALVGVKGRWPSAASLCRAVLSLVGKSWVGPRPATATCCR